MPGLAPPACLYVHSLMWSSLVNEYYVHFTETVGLHWSPPSSRNVLRPQWMPETTDSTEPCKYHVFSYIFILMMKLNL